MRRDRARTIHPLAKLLLRFVGIFAGTLIVLALAWPVLAPAYTKVASGAVRLGFHAVESPNVSVIEARGDELWIHRIVGPGQIRPFTWFDRYTFFSLIPLVALFVATPGLGWRKRVVRLPLSIGLLFLTQAAYIVISVQLTYVAVGLTIVGPAAARLLNGVQILVRVLWEAAPLVLWGAFTASAWSRQLRTLRENWKKQRATRGSESTAWRYEANKGWES